MLRNLPARTVALVVAFISSALVVVAVSKLSVPIVIELVLVTVSLLVTASVDDSSSVSAVITEVVDSSAIGSVVVVVLSCGLMVIGSSIEMVLP